MSEGTWSDDDTRSFRYFTINNWTLSPYDGDTARSLRADAATFLAAAEAFEKAGYID